MGTRQKTTSHGPQMRVRRAKNSPALAVREEEADWVDCVTSCPRGIIMDCFSPSSGASQSCGRKWKNLETMQTPHRNSRIKPTTIWLRATVLTTVSPHHPGKTKLTIFTQTKENTNYTLLLNHKHDWLHVGSLFVSVLVDQKSAKTILHIKVYSVY